MLQHDFLMLDWYVYPLLIVAGLAAGFINTLAGNGSAVVLPLLVFLGLPASVANGTNRVAVLAQSLVGFYAFKKNGLIPFKNAAFVVIPCLLGSILGASIAVELPENYLNLAFTLLMIALLVVVLANPKKWLQEQQPNPALLKSWKTMVILFLIGIHSGFLQAGTGILLLSALVLWVGYELKKANGLKLLIVATFALPNLIIFAYNGQVNWSYGIILTIGQVMGAWMAAHFAIYYPNANIWIRRLLVVIIIVAGLKFLHMYCLS